MALGLTPYCIQSCPAGAFQWGGRQAMLDQAHARVDALAVDFPEANLYGETELGGLGRLYVLLAPRRLRPAGGSGLPVGGDAVEKVVQPVGQVAFGAVALGVLGAFFVSRRRVHVEEVE